MRALLPVVGVQLFSCATPAQASKTQPSWMGAAFSTLAALDVAAQEAK